VIEVGIRGRDKGWGRQWDIGQDVQVEIEEGIEVETK
jgi:hypothetical protein